MNEHPFSITTEVTSAPWNPDHRLVRIALQGRRVDLDEQPASNLLFLLDVSGSMNSPDKLPLLKDALGLLVNNLREKDRVAIGGVRGGGGTRPRINVRRSEGSDPRRHRDRGAPYLTENDQFRLFLCRMDRPALVAPRRLPYLFAHTRPLVVVQAYAV